MFVTVRPASVMSDRIQPDAYTEQEQVRGNDHDNSSQDSAKHRLSARVRRPPETECSCDAGDAQQQKCDKYDDDHCDSHSTIFSGMAGGHRPGLARSGQHGRGPRKEVPICPPGCGLTPSSIDGRSRSRPSARQARRWRAGGRYRV